MPFELRGDVSIVEVWPFIARGSGHAQAAILSSTWPSHSLSWESVTF